MNAIVTGAGGQVGQDLLATVPATVSVRGLSHRELDIGDEAAVRTVIKGGVDLVINCAAFTAVDACETRREEAFRANAAAPGLLATACRDAGARLFHLSTDYVFDGRASAPYEVDHRVDPQGEYGRTKAEGEHRVLSSGASRPA